jgi:ketosteroid isomerase-like protein
MTQNEKRVLDFLKMVEQRTFATEFDQFYHADVEQIEFPNAITKNTATRTLADLKAASERGSKVMTKEEYEVKNLLSIGDTVILECIWCGTLAIPLGTIPIGGQMTAHFAQIFEFADGKIIRQRNYDCFDPF